MSNNEKLILDILKVEQVFAKRLTIPDYQRPYKWDIKHVEQLLLDIEHHSKKTDYFYRLGTLVIYKSDKSNQYEIVDGQQRLTTLALILYYLFEKNTFNIKSSKVKAFLENEVKPESITKLQDNYKFISSFIDSLESKREFAKYILKCEFVYIELNNLEQAFQFFDSQNSRGKALAPHDLLKAYHLRAMQNNEPEYIINNIVKQWEERIEPKYKKIGLEYIIGNILFRLRKWKKYQSAGFFTSQDIDIFKGVNQGASYLYLNNVFDSILLRGQSFDKREKLGDKNQQVFLKDKYFDVSQILINGKMFFDYIALYQDLYNILFHPENGYLNQIDTHFEKIEDNKECDKSFITFLNSYKGHDRTGDKYIRTLFESTLIAYCDRFGMDDESNLNIAIKTIFMWVYRVRVENYRVDFATIEKEISLSLREEKNNNLFYLIGTMMHPKDLMKCKIYYRKPEVEENTQDVKYLLDKMGLK